MKVKHIKQLVKTTFPNLLNLLRKIRSIYYPLLIEKQRKKLSSDIRKYYKTTNDNDILKILLFLQTNRVEMIPYEFTNKYKEQNIEVLHDDKSNHPFVILCDKKVYFPKDFSPCEIRDAVTNALIEQDDKSPHRYLTDQFNIDPGDKAILVGASDCIFCLSIIDKVSKIYLFEPDIKWITPMGLTMAPWSKKVEIIQKYVSNKNNSQNITIDSFLAERNESINYIQADIEGSEKELLAGASNTLEKGKKLKLSVCCYHEQIDESALSEILHSKGFDISYSQGYMLMWMQLPCKKPYLRKGVIYASKP